MGRSVVTRSSFPAGGRIDLDFELNRRVFLYYRNVYLHKYSALHMRQYFWVAGAWINVL